MRVTEFSYKSTMDDQNRLLDEITDAEHRDTSFTYDDAARVKSQTRPDTGGTRTVQFSYDDNGNLMSLTPPGKPAHTFSYTDVNLEEEYDPPQPTPTISDPRTLTDYTLDQEVDFVTRPDGQTIDPEYDSAGRLATVTVQSSGEVWTHAYDPNTGELNSLSGPDADLSFTYDGDLLLGETWNWGGGQSTTVARTYNNFSELDTLKVASEPVVSFGYDGDGLLKDAGELSIVSDPNHGLVASTSQGVATDTWEYSDYGEIARYTAKISGTPVFDVQYERDRLGRITKKTELIQGVTTVYEYAYDPAERLWEVWEDTVLISTYEYDANGNRTQHIMSSGTTTAVYDNQDRLQSYGAASYTYTENGELASKTVAGDVTAYDYDVFGNLREVRIHAQDPNSLETIEYLIDGRNRRVGRKVDGVLEKRWVYKDQLNPVAEFDGSGNLVAQFVYGTKPNVPEYMIKYDYPTSGTDTIFRIVSDHIGSVRLAINLATSTVERRIDYDEWGVIQSDSSPGLSPFSFAGGVSDASTTLMRFGARDYDPAVGRWTVKDPISFIGGANLYVYVSNDPVNRTDVRGLLQDVYDDAWQAEADVLNGWGQGYPLGNAYQGGFRHCRATCLTSLRYGEGIAQRSRQVWDALAENDWEPDSLRDQLAEDEGLRCAKRVRDSEDDDKDDEGGRDTTSSCTNECLLSYPAPEIEGPFTPQR